MPNCCLPADWPAPPGVRAVTTVRHGAGSSQPPFDHFNLGQHSGDAPETVAHNRAELTQRLALPAPPRWLRQVHGTHVQRFDAPTSPDTLAPEADAAVTSTPGVVLAVLTADCLPVMLTARDGSEIAAAHAGWRGLAAGVLEQTLAAMTTPAHAVMAWLGPAAGPDAYEIGQDVFDAFTRHDPRAHSAFTRTRPGHWRVDLYALARQRLMSAGVESGQIFGGGSCTLSDPQRFYSHRRDGYTGRMATLIWKNKNP